MEIIFKINLSNLKYLSDIKIFLIFFLKLFNNQIRNFIQKIKKIKKIEIEIEIKIKISIYDFELFVLNY